MISARISLSWSELVIISKVIKKYLPRQTQTASIRPQLRDKLTNFLQLYRNCDNSPQQMNLGESKVLIIDCQTTGMHPSLGHLLELAWSFSDSDDITAHLIQLPAEHELPPAVSEMTGISKQDLLGALSLEDAHSRFQEALATAEQPLTAVIHYARFEMLFLGDLFNRLGNGIVPFQILCSQRLTKRLFPNLPSQNIRAAAGFFNAPMAGIKRAASHVHATRQIWRGLCREFDRRGITSLPALEKWLSETPVEKTTRYEYQLERLKRLELPDSPGIYRMLSKSGEVLYVGKATSLKSRVNSYFRGKKGRNKQKLEMLAQVWDLKITSCATPLESALLESDEIKRYNPPYNVMLKRGRRHLIFYDRDFTSTSLKQSNTHASGPFRNSNWMEHLRALDRSLRQPVFEQIFFDPIEDEKLKAGFDLFLNSQELGASRITGVRALIALGLALVRKLTDSTDEEAETGEDGEEDEVVAEHDLTVEEIAGKFERLLRRAATEYLQAKVLTRLLNAEITLHLESGDRILRFVGGYLGENPAGPRMKLPWENLKIDDFDRMSILQSELAKYEYQIEFNI